MTPLRHLLALACIIALPALADDHPATPSAVPVRQRFVPAPPRSGAGQGASFSALHPLSTEHPEVLMLMAHAGLGDSFPVAIQDQPKAFDVKVLAGDDDLLKLEIRTEKGAQLYQLPRDGTITVQVAGHKFTLSYPVRHGEFRKQADY